MGIFKVYVPLELDSDRWFLLCECESLCNAIAVIKAIYDNSTNKPRVVKWEYHPT